MRFFFLSDSQFFNNLLHLKMLSIAQHKVTFNDSIVIIGHTNKSHFESREQQLILNDIMIKNRHCYVSFEHQATSFQTVLDIAITNFDNPTNEIISCLGEHKAYLQKKIKNAKLQHVTLTNFYSEQHLFHRRLKVDCNNSTTLTGLYFSTIRFNKPGTVETLLKFDEDLMTQQANKSQQPQTEAMHEEQIPHCNKDFKLFKSSQPISIEGKVKRKIIESDEEKEWSEGKEYFFKNKKMKFKP